MTEQEALAIIALLNAAYPANKATDTTAVVMGKMLIEYDYEPMVIATKSAMKELKFFPSLAELLERYNAAKRAMGQVPGVRYEIEAGPAADREFSLDMIRKLREEMGESDWKVRRSSPRSARPSRRSAPEGSGEGTSSNPGPVPSPPPRRPEAPSS